MNKFTSNAVESKRRLDLLKPFFSNSIDRNRSWLDEPRQSIPEIWLIPGNPDLPNVPSQHLIKIVRGLYNQIHHLLNLFPI